MKSPYGQEGLLSDWDAVEALYQFGFRCARTVCTQVAAGAYGPSMALHAGEQR